MLHIRKPSAMYGSNCLVLGIIVDLCPKVNTLACAFLCQQFFKEFYSKPQSVLLWDGSERDRQLSSYVKHQRLLPISPRRCSLQLDLPSVTVKRQHSMQCLIQERFTLAQRQCTAPKRLRGTGKGPQRLWCKPMPPIHSREGTRGFTGVRVLGALPPPSLRPWTASFRVVSRSVSGACRTHDSGTRAFELKAISRTLAASLGQ